MVGAEDFKRQLLFEDIGQAETVQLAGIIKEMSFKKGEGLFKDGDETKGIYLISTGKVEISKVTADGWKQTLAVLTPGHFFGELSIMEKRRHEASATAIENSTLMLLPKEDFERMERENAPLALKIIKKIALVMSKNLRGMNEKFMKALINY